LRKGGPVLAKSEAGRKGKDVRSDCWVSIETRPSGGLAIELRSKVESMYGTSFRKTVEEGLRLFGIENAAVEIEDTGALPFTIMARLEAAVRRLGEPVKEEFLPEMADCSVYSTRRDRMRRSRLYLPGNDPKLHINAGIHKPDGVILDLEDSVHPSEKDAARLIVRNALRQVDYMGSERMVRINQGDLGLLDLDFVIPHNVHVVLIPKVENPEQVTAVDARIQEIRKARNVESEVFLMPIVESALGAIKAYDIAAASRNNVALTIGLEDYTADIGTRRSAEGRESFWARSQVVNAARAAGIQPIDTVFSDVRDMDGLGESVLEARSLGFEGKGCIHPRQIQVIHEAFAPADEEIDRAKKVVLAFEDAQARGLGVVSLGSKMIDPPVVKRAQHTVDLAIAMGKLKDNWRDEQ
jgi:citrate lyase subunit beta/citryl-CoA lyase